MSTLAEKSIETTGDANARGNLLALWMMRGLSVLAMAVSGYLVWVALSAGEAIGCGGAMDCSKVLSSEWSTWFGLPVSIPAFSMYATLMIALLFAGPLAPRGVRKLSWAIVVALTGLAAAAGVYFIALQLILIQELCTWCITVHVAGCGMFLLTGAIAPVSIGRKFLIASSVAGVGMGLLVAGQHLQPEQPRGGLVASTYPSDEYPRPGGPGDVVVLNPDVAGTDAPGGISMSDLDGFRVVPPDEPADSTNADGSADDGDASDASDPVEPPSDPVSIVVEDSNVRKERLLRVLGGAAELNVYQYPVVGSYEAEHVMIKLFDYTCGYCRKMHHLLEAAEKTYGDRIAVLPLAVPMNKECNPHIRSASSKHADACELAALSLAVWRADADQFAGYHHWLMTGDHAPSVPVARAKAASLVGEEQLSAQLSDPQLWRRLAIGVEIYKLAKLGVVPKLLMPEVTITMSGRSMTESEFLNSLARHLKLEPVATDVGAADVLP